MFRWWCLFAVSACVRSSAVVCEDGSLCPSGTSCHQLDEQPVCVTPEQLAACGTSDEGDSCSTVRSEVGVCRSGFCAALDPCNFADQQVQVPIIDATYIDAGDDLPHASSPTLWVTPQRTTLLRLALGDNSAIAITLEVNRDGACPMCQSVVTIARVVPAWTGDATWTRRTATEAWTSAGIGKDERAETAHGVIGDSFGTLVLPTISLRAPERHELSVALVHERSQELSVANTPGARITARMTCLNARTCGNGVKEIGEACDDGNTIETDDCSNRCLRIVCGDGLVNGSEQCDDGNLESTDRCLNDCVFARCGDGFVFAGVEQCDSTPDCTSGCTKL